jgi:pseudouridine synthase
MAESTPQRLQKILAASGVASRRSAEGLILAGRVRVNGKVVSTLGSKAVWGEDQIMLDNRILEKPEPLAYYMFNKPEGYLTALSDGKLKRPTIREFLDPLPCRVYPVGRLDRDTTGFLLLTNDGELARRLMHPSYKAPKVYRALVKGHPSPQALEILQNGTLAVDGKKVQKAKARMLESGPDRGFLEIVLTEGRHHQVKLMCAQIGHPVEKLKRVAYSGLTIDPNLDLGGIRKLTPKEIEVLKMAAGLLKAPSNPPQK